MQFRFGVVVERAVVESAAIASGFAASERARVEGGMAKQVEELRAVLQVSGSERERMLFDQLSAATSKVQELEKGVVVAEEEVKALKAAIQVRNDRHRKPLRAAFAAMAASIALPPCFRISIAICVASG
mgnify:CR=1 FL=1